MISAVILSGIALVVSNGQRGPVATSTGSPGLPAIPSFPSAEILPPGATPGTAVTIPLVRPEFQYIGDAPWQLQRCSGWSHVIEGFASRPSYLPGETLRLAVSTTAARYEGTIFRVSGTAPAASPFVAMTHLASQAGSRQIALVVDSVTKMVSAPWTFTTSFAIPADWPSGVYLVRLESDEHVQSFVPFVVRSPRATRYLVVSSALNWQAYNPWGGSNLYRTKVGQPIPGVDRALAVSFDRPYGAGGGAGQLFSLELPMIAWMERQGLDLSFTTDYDLSVSPDTQPLPRAVIFNGHSEYWGVPLRLWLERHVLQAGDVRLGVFAADTGYWPVVLSGAGPDGPRIVTSYKNGPLPGPASPYGPPPMNGPAASGEATLEPGGEDEIGVAPPFPSLPPTGPYPEPLLGAFDVRALLGVAYQHVTTAMAEYSLADPGVPALLTGTGIAPRSPLGFFAGGEVDAARPRPGLPTPSPGGSMRPSSVADAVIAGAYGIPSRKGRISDAEAVWRVLPNGSAVFASGTFYWGWALDPEFAVAHEVVPGFERLTLNILSLLGG